MLSTLTILLVIVGAIHFLLKDSCGNQIHQSFTSPKNKYKIVVFQRDCGATTNYSTQISLLRKKQSLSNKGGNIFIGESITAPINNQGVFYIEVEWINKKTVLIKYPKNIKIYKQDYWEKGITLKYEIVETPTSFH